MSYAAFASESVCAGHPDKVCDQISDAIVDAILTRDPHGRIAVETAVTAGRIILLGEVTSSAHVDYEAIARRQVKRLGYTNPDWGFHYQNDVQVYIGQQSPEIAQGVDADGAGDQGMMFGYACRETPQLMPLPITLAHGLARKLDELRESGQLAYLRPDGKAQVVVNYDAAGQPVSVGQVTLAAPHAEDASADQVKHDLYRQAVLPVLAQYGYEVPESALIVNGTGVWHHPGPASDAGLTGRKIIVDSYGGYARVGGGAFSGKDPTKVDRSGAYAARYLAKNIVAAGLASRAEVGLAYVIGQAAPVMQSVDTFGTATASPQAIADFAARLLDCSVRGILDGLNLRRPIYLPTASYGHFGTDDDRPWEAIASI